MSQPNQTGTTCEDKGLWSHAKAMLMLQTGDHAIVEKFGALSLPEIEKCLGAYGQTLSVKRSADEAADLLNLAVDKKAVTLRDDQYLAAEVIYLSDHSDPPHLDLCRSKWREERKSHWFSLSSAVRFIIETTNVEGEDLAIITSSREWAAYPLSILPMYGKLGLKRFDEAKSAWLEAKELLSQWLQRGEIVARDRQGVVPPDAWSRPGLDWWESKLSDREDLRVPRADLEHLLVEVGTYAVAARVRQGAKFSTAQLETWWEEYEAKRPRNKRAPGLEEDWAAAREAFPGAHIPRSAIISLRKKFRAPAVVGRPPRDDKRHNSPK